MSEELDAIGTSLLNRVSAGRREAQRDLRRQQQIQAALRVVQAGVRVGNQVLERRAEEVTNRDDFQTNQALVSRSMRDATRILDEDVLAQQYPGGVVSWLAENKFKQPILDNFNRTFPNRELYSSEDIDNWVNAAALEEAAKYEGAWNGAVQAANKISNSGTIEDYNDYVKLNDGVAENVGGLLFNKASNYLTGRTDRDVNSEIVDAIRNNRFVDNAQELALFNERLNAGINVQSAKNFAKGVATSLYPKGVPVGLEGLGIRKQEDLPFIPTDLEQIEVEVFVGGMPTKQYVNKVTGRRGTTNITRIEPVVRNERNENGVEVTTAVDPEAYRALFVQNDGVLNGVQMSLDSSMFSGLSQEDNNSFVTRLVELKKVKIADEPFTTSTKVVNAYGDTVKVEVFPVYDRFTKGLTDPKRQVTQFVLETPQKTATTLTQKEEAIPTASVNDAVAALRETAANTFVSDGKSMAELDLLNRAMAGTDYEDFKDGKRSIENSVDRAGRQVSIHSIELQTKYDLAPQEARDTAVLAYLSNINDGWNPETELVDRRNAPDYIEQTATAAFLGLNLLANTTTTAEMTGRVVGNTALFNKLAFGTYNELDSLIRQSNNASAVEKGNLLLDRVLATSGIEGITINLNEEKDLRPMLVAAYGDSFETANQVTMPQLLQALSPEKFRTPAPPTESAVNPEDYRGEEVEPQNIALPTERDIRNREIRNFTTAVAQQAMEINKLNPSEANAYARDYVNDLLSKELPLELPK